MVFSLRRSYFRQIMEGCQVFIKEEMDDHSDTKDWGSSSAKAFIKKK